MRSIDELLNLVEQDGNTQGMTSEECDFYFTWIEDRNAEEVLEYGQCLACFI